MNLFDNQPRVTLLDTKRLMPLLSGWGQLSPALKTMTEDDIKKCVVIEAAGAQRPMILARLLGRYNKRTRQRILHAVKNPGT
jgi:hypothetical protein